MPREEPHKGTWTEPEDQAITREVESAVEKARRETGAEGAKLPEDKPCKGYSCVKWVAVAEAVGTRCAKQCRERWYQQLRPGLKKGSFSPQEIEFVFQQIAIHGDKWALIADMMGDRSDNAIKNLVNSLRNKEKRLAGGKAIAHPPPSSAAHPPSSTGHAHPVPPNRNRPTAQSQRPLQEPRAHQPPAFRTTMPPIGAVATPQRQVDPLRSHYQWTAGFPQPETVHTYSRAPSSAGTPPLMDDNGSSSPPNPLPLTPVGPGTSRRSSFQPGLDKLPPFSDLMRQSLECYGPDMTRWEAMACSAPMGQRLGEMNREVARVPKRTDFLDLVLNEEPARKRARV